MSSGASTTTSTDGKETGVVPAEDITTLIGREVYSSRGMYVGEVEDVRLDLDAERVSGLAITALNDDLFADVARNARGIIVPYRWVRAVGDVILVHDLIEHPKPDDEAE